MDFKQSSFLGGMIQRLDATKVPNAGDSYYLGINVRNREDNLQPITKPLDITDSTPPGKKQGIYGSGKFLILFIDGKPYARDVSRETTGFIPLNAQQLDPNVDYIYLEFVPASTLGFGRLRAPDSDEVSIDVNQELPFKSSQQGAIYQDGINRAQLILDNTTDVTPLQNFAEWTTDIREYVPLMKQMLYSSSILFGLSADGKEVYHSVSGRPIDFMVVILEDGSKLESEQSGGATSVSKRVDFEVATAIKAAPTQDTLIITTLNKIFLVLINKDRLQFGEPTLDAFPIAAIGAVNQWCFADLNGDTAFINNRGIHSFNSAAILKRESNNDPLSGVINRLFALDDTNYVVQDFPCAFEFGADYALFAVNTIYGRGVLVYDKIASKFVSLDIYEGISQIKQFADVVVDGRRRLFFITTDDKVYEHFAGDSVEQAGLFIGEWCTNDPKITQKPLYLRLVFTECEEDGNVSVTPIVNRQAFTPKVERIKALTPAPTFPMSIPFGSAEKNAVQNVTFNLTGTVMAGWKVGTLINWDVKAKLTHIALESDSQTAAVSPKANATRFTAINDA